MGRSGYIAPEQAHSLKSADARSDIFSLGILLHYLYTGQLPGAHNTPHPVWQVVKKAVSTSPDDRHSSVDDLLGHYSRLVDLSSGAKDIADVLSTPESESVNWPIFCDFIAANHSLDLDSIRDHIVFFLGRRQAASAAYADLPSSFDTATCAFLNALADKQGVIRYPWDWISRAIYSIGSFIITHSESYDAITDAAFAMWDDAIVGDRWAAQEETIAILLTANFPTAARMALGDYILNSATCVSTKHMPSDCPKEMRSAIIQWHREHPNCIVHKRVSRQP